MAMWHESRGGPRDWFNQASSPSVLNGEAWPPAASRVTRTCISTKITSPADLRALDLNQLDELCREIREFVVNSVSKTGGHLGSNLGGR